MLTAIIYITLLLAAIGIIIGWHNQKKGVRWGQPLAVICAILGIAIGFVQVYVTALGGLNQNVASHIRNREYERAKGIVLGQYVRTHFAGKRILILKDPTTKDEDALMAFRREIYNHTQMAGIIAPTPTPIAKPNDNSNVADYAPSDVWFTKKNLESLLAKQNYDVLVTCLGLPEEVIVFGKEFNASGLRGKKVVFLAGNIHSYVRGFMSGRLAAAVIANPDVLHDAKSVPRDPKAAFDKRYLLITPENYREMMEQHNVFKR